MPTKEAKNNNPVTHTHTHSERERETHVQLKIKTLCTDEGFNVLVELVVRK